MATTRILVTNSLTCHLNEKKDILQFLLLSFLYRLFSDYLCLCSLFSRTVKRQRAHTEMCRRKPTTVCDYGRTREVLSSVGADVGVLRRTKVGRGRESSFNVGIQTCLLDMKPAVQHRLHTRSKLSKFISTQQLPRFRDLAGSISPQVPWQLNAQWPKRLEAKCTEELEKLSSRHRAKRNAAQSVTSTIVPLIYLIDSGTKTSGKVCRSNVQKRQESGWSSSASTSNP